MPKRNDVTGPFQTDMTSPMTMTMFFTNTMNVASDTDILSKLDIADAFNNYIRCVKHTLTATIHY